MWNCREYGIRESTFSPDWSRVDCITSNCKAPFTAIDIRNLDGDAMLESESIALNILYARSLEELFA